MLTVRFTIWSDSFLYLQVEDLTSLLLADSNDGVSPCSTWSEDQTSADFPQAFALGFSSLMLDLSSLNPSPDQALCLWTVFSEKVDPHCKILHKPTARSALLESEAGQGGLAKGMEPLAFSIYFAAIMKMSQGECITYLQEDRSMLLTKYRFAVEQALARAEFLTSAEMPTLQALAIFMVREPHWETLGLIEVLIAAIHRYVFIYWKTLVLPGLS